MRTLAKLFIICIALLALAAAFLWKHLTAPATPEQPATVAASQPLTGNTPTPANTQSATPAANPATTSPVDKVKAFEALKQRAKAGDAVSQRLLAQAYEACFAPNRDRERFVQHYQLARQAKPEEAAILDRAARQRLEDCDAVDGGAIIPMELIDGWYAQAAENGDLVARANHYAKQRKPLDTATATRFLDDVIASGDPAALYSLSSGLGSNMAADMGEPYKDLVSGPMASQAWAVAACRLGYDCGPDSSDVVSICLLISRCQGETAEELMFALTRSDEERATLERKAQQIIDAVTP